MRSPILAVDQTWTFAAGCQVRPLPRRFIGCYAVFMIATKNGDENVEAVTNIARLLIEQAEADLARS